MNCNFVTLLTGIASAAYPLGPVLGFGFAAGFLRLPENLKGIKLLLLLLFSLLNRYKLTDKLRK